MVKGYKKPNFKPSEECINTLKKNNIKRGLEKRKEWEAIAEANKMICRTCNLEKNLDMFCKRKHPDYIMWVRECRDCENKRKDSVAKKRVLSNGLEWNIKQILRGIKQRSSKFERECDIDVEFLVELYNQQEGICPYSGRKMVFDINSPERLSLDRKDSNEGYIQKNVVWCCWQANNIKQDLSMDEFKKWVNIINSQINRTS